MSCARADCSISSPRSPSAARSSAMRCASIWPTVTPSRAEPSVTRSPTLPLYSPRFWSIITCSLALLGSLVLAAGCDSGPKFKSADITGADYGKSLDLTDHTGKPRHLEDFHGK